MNDDYRRIAKIYDLFFSAALRQLRQDIRTYVFHRNYHRVVDICCGTGEQLHLLSRSDMQLCGIDNSLAMLERARTRCPEQVELHYLDAEQDSFSANSFDCVILSLALHEKHPATATTIYSNSHKLLRQQGALIIADFNQPPPGIIGTVLGKCLIPLVERCGGTDHFRRYSHWLENGGVVEFLARRNLAAEVISQPLHGNIICCAVIKDDDRKAAQHNFALLDLNLRSKKEAVQSG